MSGTLLSDLDSSPTSTDDSAVQRILNEMNGAPQQLSPPQIQMRAPQPPAQQVINSPNPNSTLQHSMDSQPSTAHMIGMDHPTNADFAAMMYNQRAPQQQQFASAQQPQWNMQPPIYQVPGKNYTSNILKEIKTPLLVSILIFIFSLPVVNIMVSHYFPTFVKGTGELTTFGLLLKSILAGSAFWILQRIIAPLLVGY